MAKRFDANRTWDEAVRMFRANRELVLILAGLFFLLPALIAAAFAPEALSGPQIADPENAGPIVQAWAAENWVNVLLLQILQLLGLLSLLALLARRRPTVSEAIKDGLAALLPMVLAQLIVSLLFLLVFGTILGIFGLAGGAGVILGLIIAVPLAFYLLARLSTLTPVFVFEDRRNPIKAIWASWNLTKGAGWRIAGFFALLVIAAVVISAVFGLIGTLITALMGNDELALFVSLGLSALIGTVLQAILACVLAALYRQLQAREAPSALEPNA